MLQINYIIICIIHKFSAFLNFFFFKKRKIPHHVMTESLSLEEEENIIKNVRNLFRLEKLKKKQLVPQLKT